MAADSVMPTTFPAAFAERVKKRFPINEGLHEALERADPGPALAILDRYVHDALVRGIGASRIIELLEAGQSEALLQEAQRIVADEELYREARGYAHQVPHPWRRAGQPSDPGEEQAEEE